MLTQSFRTPLLLCLAALAGCSAATSGPGSQSGSATPVATYNFNGSWKIVATSTLASQFSVDEFDGTLQATNGVVTGTLTPQTALPNPVPGQGPCPAANQPIQVTGALDTDHNLNLSFPISGGTATIQATLADNPGTPALGLWQIVGGTCAMAAVDFVMQQTATAGPPVTSTPTPLTAANFSGNWRINTDYAGPVTSPLGTPPLGITGFDTSLQLSGDAVSGSLFLDYYTQPYIQGVYVPFAVAGTLDPSNHLTLNTAPAPAQFLGGGTLTITATLDPNTHTLSDGSYQIAGGPFATPPTAVTVAQYANITGTYTGVLQDPGFASVPRGNPDTVTAVLTQSATPLMGIGAVVYSLNGTVTVSGGCSTTFTIPIESYVAGGKFAAYDPSGSYFVGSINPDASSLFQVTFNTAACGSLEGNLMRQ